MLQPDFAAALLKEAHDRGFNTAIETACNVPWAYIEKVLPHVDTMLHDHKLTIPERHKKWTGVDNKRILENFKKAYETFPNIDFIARTPLIPGVNADEEHIRAVLAFIRPHKNVIDYELLPYHRFGLGKYELLGEVYELDDYKTPSDEVVQRLPGHHRRSLWPQWPKSPGCEMTSRSEDNNMKRRLSMSNPDKSDRYLRTAGGCAGRASAWLSQDTLRGGNKTDQDGVHARGGLACRPVDPHPETAAEIAKRVGHRRGRGNSVTREPDTPAPGSPGLTRDGSSRPDAYRSRARRSTGWALSWLAGTKPICGCWTRNLPSSSSNT